MKKKLGAVCLTWVLLAGALIGYAGAVESTSISKIEETVILDYTETDQSISYRTYCSAYQSQPIGSEVYVIKADSYCDGMGVTVKQNIEGIDGACLETQKDSTVTYSLPQVTPGLYRIELSYYPIIGTSNKIERRLLIDGKVPFEEAERFVFSRVWGNDGEPSVDDFGNESRPSQIEKPRWNDAVLRDEAGTYSEGFSFYFDGGNHTLTLEGLREPMLLKELRLTPAVALPSYQQVSAEYRYPKIQGDEAIFTVEAEDATAKSDATLYPTWDRSSSKTSPMDYHAIKLNTIGGSQWKVAGQWLEWEIDVPEDGLYRLGFRARQNITSGIFSTRRLLIDGEVPFAEANEIRIYYSGNWQFIIPGDDNGDYYFELKKGKRTIRLEVVMGEMGEIIEKTDSLLQRLNEVYREIIVITGASPDPFRDYYLDQEVPESLEKLSVLSDELTAVSNDLTELFGGRSDQNALLDRLATQAKQIAKQPETVSKTLTSFKSNIASLATWTLGIREQSLELDAIYLLPEGMEKPQSDDGFFAGLWHEIRLLFAAFTSDYNQIGYEETDEKPITVWVTSGREQATIIDQLIRREYSGKIGGAVDVELVAAGTLLPSVLSGRGPDVALGNASTNVMDFALRDALLPVGDLLQGELKDSFYESALIPLQLEGVQYALPETQTFPILFYRTDILEELGIKVPSTWEDLYSVLRELQKRYMDFGMPATISGYSILLYQSGGSFYKNNGRESALAEDVNVRTFRNFTNLYLNYSLPMAYDFANRFRSGEMPIGIADYTMYNQLTVFAPEISGLWNFAPMIGTVQEDGSVDRSVTGVVSGAMILKATEDSEACKKFLSWWVGAEAQAIYAREQESIMGSAARYATANRKTMEQIAWDTEQLKVLLEQWEAVKAIPEVPGGYYTSRYVDFAFRDVVIQRKEVRKTLLDSTSTIDKELQYKRKEFKLD